MKRKLARIFIIVVIPLVVFYLSLLSYRAGKKGIFHLLEKILKSPITYETFHFNPLSHVTFSKFNSSSLSADTLEIRFNLLDLLFRKIEFISGKNVYLNIDTLVSAYSKGENGGGVPVFEISSIFWDSTILVAGGITFRSRLLTGSMRGINNSLVIPFKAFDIHFLDNTYRIVTSTVIVFSDSTVLYDVQADSRKIFVKNGKMKITSGPKLTWQSDSVRYQHTTMKHASGSIFRNKYVISAGKSNIMARYPVNSMYLEFTTEDFNTLNFQKFKFTSKNDTITGAGTVSNLKKGNLNSISYNLSLNIERFSLPEKGLKFSGYIHLVGIGTSGNVDARLRNVFYRDNTFRQVNLVSKYKGDTFFVDFGEIIDPDLNLNFSGIVSRDTQNLRFSGSGYNLATYLKKPFETSFYKFSGELIVGKNTKRFHGVATFKGIGFKKIKAPYMQAEIDYVNGNTRVFALSENVKIGSMRLDSTLSKINLSSYHMGNYSLDAFSGDKKLSISGKFYLDSSGIYISNERLSCVLNGIQEETTSPVFLTWSGGYLKIQADTIHVFKGTLKNLAFDLEGDTIRGKISMENLDISLIPVRTAFKTGILNGSFELHGTLSKPVLSFKGNLAGTILKNVEIDTIRGEVLYSEGRILSPMTVIKGDRFSIYSDFVVPAKFSISPYRFFVETQAPIHGEIVLDKVDATIITDILEGGVYPESGHLCGNLILLGTLKNPELSGKLELKSSNTFIEAFGNEYREIFLQMEFRDQRVEISQIRIEGDEGFADGKGSIDLQGLKPGFISVSLNLWKFPFARGDFFNGIFNGFLNIEGSLPDDIIILGDLSLDEAYVYLSFGRSGGAGKMRPNPVKINLRVRADRRVFLVNELANMEFSADLTIVKEDPVTVLISGKLDVIKGTFLYLDRTFIIQEGSIVFNNESEINPTLNLLGETVINDTIFIELHVTGSVKVPEIQLTSSPPLSEEDIISLLSFGKLLSEVPFTIRDISLMKTRALNLAEGLISRELQKRLRINELELRTGLAGENPRFTVGLYLSPRVYFRYAHSFEALEKDIYQVKYFLKRNFAIYGERDREGEISIGVEARYRF